MIINHYSCSHVNNNSINTAKTEIMARPVINDQTQAGLILSLCWPFVASGWGHRINLPSQGQPVPVCAWKLGGHLMRSTMPNLSYAQPHHALQCTISLNSSLFVDAEQYLSFNLS